MNRLHAEIFERVRTIFGQSVEDACSSEMTITLVSKVIQGELLIVNKNEKAIYTLSPEKQDA